MPADRPPAAAPGAADGGIVVTELTVRYQGTPEPAIQAISCRVAPGAGLCVAGPEGAGKSTLVRALVGLVAPVRGQVAVLGSSPRLPAVRRRIGYAPDRLPFPNGMRVRDAVRLVGAIRGTDESPDVALERVGLPAADHRVISSLALGDVRRVSLACAITGMPEVLILDDPWEYPETVQVIRDARAAGATVLVASPDPGGYPDLLGATLTLAEGRAT